jgi:hypothetical protein
MIMKPTGTEKIKLAFAAIIIVVFSITYGVYALITWFG